MLVWVITLVIVTWKITATETGNIGSVKRSTTLWTSAPPPPFQVFCLIFQEILESTPSKKRHCWKTISPFKIIVAPTKILHLSIYRFRERAEHSLDWSILTSTVTQIGIWKLPPPTTKRGLCQKLRLSSFIKLIPPRCLEDSDCVIVSLISYQIEQEQQKLQVLD